jgi:hypothetical protein
MKLLERLNSDTTKLVTDIEKVKEAFEFAQDKQAIKLLANQIADCKFINGEFKEIRSCDYNITIGRKSDEPREINKLEFNVVFLDTTNRVDYRFIICINRYGIIGYKETKES